MGCADRLDHGVPRFIASELVGKADPTYLELREDQPKLVPTKV